MIKNYTTIALNENKDRIKIKNAKKGVKYFCEGCGARKIVITEFVRRDIAKYFKHYSKDVHIHQNSCKWSDENTLHKMAMDILQIKKCIKVPSVIKTSPDGNGLAYKIRDSKIIQAHFIENEMSYFEDNEGVLKWKRLSRHELTLIKDKSIRPDVSFFNSMGIPILFVEIIVTNDISEDKYLKIKRFGIDTVKVIISTLDLEMVNTCFDKTTFTKWVYNNDEQRTTYISISDSSGKAVLSADEDEDGIYAENFNCRRNEIRNFIRTVERCLEQESYYSIKRELDRQLYEFEQYSERASERLRNLQERYKGEVEKEFESKAFRIGNEEREFDNSEEEFSNRFGELEERYLIKAEKLRDLYDNYKSPDQEEIDRIEQELRRLEINGFTLGERTESIRIRRETLERTISFLERERGNIEIKIFGVEEETLQISERFNRESEKFTIDREAIEGKFDRITEELIRGFETRNYEQTSSLGKLIKEIVNAGAFLDIIEQSNREFIELRNAKEIIKSEAWRDWDWS